MRMSAGDKIFGVLRSPGRRLDASWGGWRQPANEDEHGLSPLRKMCVISRWAVYYCRLVSSPC